MRVNKKMHSGLKISTLRQEHTEHNTNRVNIKLTIQNRTSM